MNSSRAASSSNRASPSRSRSATAVSSGPSPSARRIAPGTRAGAARSRAGRAVPARDRDGTAILAGPPPGPHAHRRAAVVSSAAATAGTSAARLGRRSAAWLAQFAEDLRLGLPFRSPPPSPSSLSEVLGGGRAAGVTARVADRVRSLYGLSHTLAAPLRTDSGLIGAIVLSRRDREPWPVAARRLLEGAAVEAAAAMARAYSFREATAHASTDPLTGLPNRRYFDEFCGLLARRRRAGDAVGVLMIDIDHFKAINDEHGHEVGDAVLAEVARRIAAQLRAQDTAARWGGEEFLLLLPETGARGGGVIARKVCEAVAQEPFAVDGAGVQRTLSIGVCEYRTGLSIDQCIQYADRAMYAGKRAGKNRVVVRDATGKEEMYVCGDRGAARD